MIAALIQRWEDDGVHYTARTPLQIIPILGGASSPTSAENDATVANPTCHGRVTTPAPSQGRDDLAGQFPNAFTAFHTGDQ